MDTKSKKFSANTGLRVVVFLLCIVMATISVMGIVMMGASMSQTSYMEFSSLFHHKDYIDSMEFEQEFDRKADTLLYLLEEYGSEANIEAGGSIDSSELKQAVNELYWSGSTRIGGQLIEANYDYEGYESDVELEGEAFDAFTAANAPQLEVIKDSLIAADLRGFRSAKQHLDETEGFFYFVSDGSNTITNLSGSTAAPEVAARFSEFPAYLIYDNGNFEKNPRSDEYYYYHGYGDMYLEEELAPYFGQNLVLGVGFNEQYLSMMSEEYSRTQVAMTRWLPVVFGSAAMALFLLIWLMVTTGPKQPDGSRKLYMIDRIWTEVQFLAMGTAATCAGALCIESMYYAYTYSHLRGIGSQSAAGYLPTEVMSWEILLMLAGFAVTAAIAIWFLLSQIRLLKAKRFWKNSILYKLFAFAGSAVLNVLNGGSLMRKVTVLALGICLLSATIFLAPVVFIVLLVFAPKWISRFEEIQKGVDEVKSGNLTYKIPIAPNSKKDELTQLAEGINEISEASNLAVQNELKNQRMKTELISNVSHDLKTPLTSMVSYIDLLKTEGLDSPNAPEYLDILDQKTERLRKLTEDLFEAAKASSGAMPVNMETVDLLSLINQSMGEMNDRIEASSLDFILNAEKDKYYVSADGQLLYRVVENLLGNVLKYAQDGSRVYIDIKEPQVRTGGPAAGKSENTQEGGHKGMVVLEIKNISKQQLNVSPDELMERFKRGDDSRSTEGSGLGLAIAKDLVKLMNGWFEIKIDGDLFKTRVMLNAAKAPVHSMEEERSE